MSHPQNDALKWVSCLLLLITPQDDDLSLLFQSVTNLQSVPACVARRPNMASLHYGFVSFQTVEDKEVRETICFVVSFDNADPTSPVVVLAATTTPLTFYFTENNTSFMVICSGCYFEV